MWNRNPSIFWGIVLVVLGVLFLLSNLDININWSIVWPVVLIALGVWLLVARVGPGGASAGLDSAEARDGLTKAKLEVAVGSGRIDVRSTDLGDQLYRTHIEHAGTAPEVNLDRATGTVRISQRLDWFAGARRVRIEGGALTVNLARPAGAAVKVAASGGAVQLRGDGSHQDGIGSRDWRSTGYDAATDRYDVTVSGGALRVNISSR